MLGYGNFTPNRGFNLPCGEYPALYHRLLPFGCAAEAPGELWEQPGRAGSGVPALLRAATTSLSLCPAGRAILIPLSPCPALGVHRERIRGDETPPGGRAACPGLVPLETIPWISSALTLAGLDAPGRSSATACSSLGSRRDQPPVPVPNPTCRAPASGSGATNFGSSLSPCP